MVLVIAGGIRVNAWVSGGFLPAKVRGTKYEGLACGWDWYGSGIPSRFRTCSIPTQFPLDLHAI